MQRSKVEITLHFVWTTHRREPLLNTEVVERSLFRCIASECQRLNCELLALNGMPDHIHLLVKMPSNLLPSRLAQAAKGISAQMANSKLGFEGAFKWQDHYAVFSVSPSHIGTVVRYIEKQKQHHAIGKLWAKVEEFENESED